MKLLGIVGGMSWESTIVYYRLINEAIMDRLVVVDFMLEGSR